MSFVQILQENKDITEDVNRNKFIKTEINRNKYNGAIISIIWSHLMYKLNHLCVFFFAV